MPLEQITYSQVDITERFGDDLSLTVDDWISTSSLNSTVPNAQSMGLPSIGATDDEVYRIAERLSRIRESAPIPGDGVYCPVCHIANVTLARLRTPCPPCGRELLRRAVGHDLPGGADIPVWPTGRFGSVARLSGRTKYVTSFRDYRMLDGRPCNRPRVWRMSRAARFESPKSRRRI